MQIDNNSVVTFHYTLTEAGGEQIENSRDGEPTVYLHGGDNILPAMDAAFAGHQAGDSLRIELTAEQAYGERRDNSVERVPAKYLKHEGKLRPGQVVRLHLKDGGSQPAVVIKVGKFAVDLDTNHPLAGKALCFDVEIVDVRAATDEELNHGHAHGPGGHQH